MAQNSNGDKVPIKQEEKEAEEEEEALRRRGLVLGVERPDVLTLVDGQQDTAELAGGGLLILEKTHHDQLWPAAFTRRFLRFRYRLRELDEDGPFRTELPRENDSLEATPLPPGLYSAGLDSARLYLSRALGYNLASALAAAQQPIDTLPAVTQVLVLAAPGSDEERRHALLSPVRGRTGALTFSAPNDIYLDEMLPADTQYVWFRGRAPRANQLVGNAKANPDRPVLAPGTYTLWAMQYDVERDRDDTGAPLVRWRLVQVMQAGGYDLTEEASEGDLVLNEEHVLTERETFVLPNSRITGAPFARWRYRPLDGDVWRPLPQNMRRRKGDPATQAEADPRGEYALQGVYRAMEPLIQERLLLLIKGAELTGRLEPPANLVAALDEEREVDGDGVRQILQGLATMQSAIGDKLAARAAFLNGQERPESYLMALEVDSVRSWVDNTARLLQYRWLASYYTDLFRQAGAEVLSTSNVENITTLLTAIQESVNRIPDNKPAPPADAAAAVADAAAAAADSQATSTLVEKTALYAPTFLPAVRALLADAGEDPAAFLEALNEHREIALALERTMAEAVAEAHPTDNTVVAAQEEVDEWLRAQKPDIYRQPQVAHQKAAEIKRTQDTLEAVQDARGGGALELQQQQQQQQTMAGTGTNEDRYGTVTFRAPLARLEQVRQAGQSSGGQVVSDVSGGVGPATNVFPAELRRRLATQAKIGAPLLRLHARPDKQPRGGFIAPWQRLHALLFLRWQALMPNTPFPEPLALVSFYAHQVRAAVLGRDVNTGRVYDVARPVWGQSVWWASIREAKKKKEEEEELVAARLRVRLMDDNVRSHVPFYRLIETALQDAPSGSKTHSVLQTVMAALRILANQLRDYINQDGGKVKYSVQGLLHPKLETWIAVQDMSLVDLEKVVRAYEVVDLLPDLSAFAYATDPGSATDHVAPRGPMHPMERLGGRTGVWVGMPSSWRAGPQLHDPLEQVIERIEAFRLEREAIAKDPALRTLEQKREALEQAAASLAAEPFRWSSLYVPLEHEMLTAMHHGELAIMQPGPPAPEDYGNARNLLVATERGVTAASGVLTT